MKVIDVAEFYSPTAGGVRTYIDDKIALAGSLGHEVVVIAPGREARVEERAGGRIIWVPSQRLVADGNYRLFWNFAPVHRLIAEEKPDVIEASSPWTAAWIVAAWRGPGLKSLFLHADPVANYPYRWFERLLSVRRIDQLFGWYWRHLRALDRRFDVTVVPSAMLRERMAGYGLRGPVAVPLGVDVSAFSPALRDPALRADLLARCGLSEDAILMVGVGRHHPEKRWPLLMRGTQDPALGRKIGFVIVGDGLRRREVDAAAAGYPHVHVAGRVNDRAALARLVASADAFVHGSATETFGLSVAEALASGLPIIVPDAGGAADFADPDYAETYRAGDAASLQAALLRFFARDRDAMAARAAEAGGELSSPRDHVRALFALYERELGLRTQNRGEQVLVAA